MRKQTGICTILYKLSTPSSVLPLTGTPTTGSVTIAATIPGRCAAPPAPAIMTFNPLPLASFAKETIRSGVRCADTIVNSKGTLNERRISAAGFMTGRSESEPIIIATTGCGAVVGRRAVSVFFAFSVSGEDEEESSWAASMRGEIWYSASAMDPAMSVMWPILRAGLGSRLP